ALLDRRDDERVARVDPGPRGFVAAEELRELAILQAEPVVVGPVRRALPWSGIYPQIAASGDRPVRSVEPPRTLDVQRKGADGTLSGRMRPNLAEMQAEHVGRPADDREAQPDQHIKAIASHRRIFGRDRSHRAPRSAAWAREQQTVADRQQHHVDAR